MDVPPPHGNAPHGLVPQPPVDGTSLPRPTRFDQAIGFVVCLESELK